MVNAILEGRKTQTRRVVSLPAWVHASDDGDDLSGESPMACHRDTGCLASINCPYGTAGDRLWVRESWLQLRCNHRHDATKPNDWLVPWGDKPRRNGCAYKADATSESERCRLELGYKNWTPSIHMPRWASRITLEVTNVRVERLREITEADSQAEGVEMCEHFAKAQHGHPLQPHRTAFAWLWASIHGRDSWCANPWVWVVEFKRVDETIGTV